MSYPGQDLEAALKDKQAFKKACSWVPEMAYVVILFNLVLGTPPYLLFIIASFEQAAKDYRNLNYILTPVGFSHTLGATEDQIAKQMNKVIMAKKPPVTAKWIVLKDQYFVNTSSVYVTMNNRTKHRRWLNFTVMKEDIRVI
ncbi:hypothetical protein B0J17DRAFT_632959 [Rhizoctonia solani]|nr:hypothetical protein B0J17DRAFT_632959 [Rhizoctonia solani]